MIYTSIYNKLVLEGRNNKVFYKKGSGLEKHHIVPTHAGGLDEESNYTYLTRRHHIIAHYLLWKMYKMNGDKWALCRMSGKNYPSGENHPAWGIPLTEEHKAKLRGQKRSAKTKELMRKRYAGEGNNFFGNKHTKETLAQMHRKVACPHCGKEGNIPNMKRWHFDNCKLNSSVQG
jgi:hypothetical protein|tara:strand:- start:18 stop:542 length:525 start_codon:yes stop_codon:yes gene_type:complete